MIEALFDQRAGRPGGNRLVHCFTTEGNLWTG